MAREAGLDLVEVAPTARPPVCKILDYGKWRYQQQKKVDKSRASARAGQLKELKLKTVKIGEHDLMIKINHAREFLKEGNKVQFTLQFKGREMAHQELGRDIFVKIKTELFMVSKVERDSKMEGRRMTLVLQPDHKQPGAKQPGVAGTAPAGRQGPNALFRRQRAEYSPPRGGGSRTRACEARRGARRSGGPRADRVGRNAVKSCRLARCAFGPRHFREMDYPSASLNTARRRARQAGVGRGGHPNIPLLYFHPLTLEGMFGVSSDFLWPINSSQTKASASGCG